MSPKLETWAQPVQEEMERNGYRLIVSYTRDSAIIGVSFCKGTTLRGRSEGPASDYSFIVVRAAIAAYKEDGEPQGLVK